MNEKRFALEYYSNCYKCISDNEQKKLYSSRESICDLLNQLNDENEQLKKELKIAIGEMMTDYKNLEKENERLQKELDSFKPVMFQDMRKGTIILYSKG